MGCSQNPETKRVQLLVSAILSDALWWELTLEATVRFPNETGGILMGGCSGDRILITDVVGPGPNAVHETTWFRPDYDYHDAEVARLYRESAGTTTYLGDWHSHPGASEPHLSGKDKRVIRNIAQSAEARAPNPLMLMLFGGSVQWNAFAWVGELKAPILGWRALKLYPCGVTIHKEAEAEGQT